MKIKEKCGRKQFLRSLYLKSFKLPKVYGPNSTSDSPEFCKNVSDLLKNFNNDSNLITKDFNFEKDQTLDTQNYCNVNNPKRKM